MAKQLSSGKSLVIEIGHPENSSEIVSNFRELIGPADPDLARTVRPKSLRAKYGKTKVSDIQVKVSAISMLILLNRRRMLFIALIYQKMVHLRWNTSSKFCSNKNQRNPYLNS